MKIVSVISDFINIENYMSAIGGGNESLGQENIDEKFIFLFSYMTPSNENKNDVTHLVDLSKVREGKRSYDICIT